ncbi:TPA: hypothetical protein ACW7X5_000084 [Elizabethkingia meningoseptica]
MIKQRLFQKVSTIAYVAISFWAVSCRSADTENNLHGDASVKINLQGSMYDDARDFGPQAASGHIVSAIAPEQIQEISFNHQYKLIARFTPEKQIQTSLLQASSGMQPMAAAFPQALAADIKYKVLVYDTSGKFVTERNYIRGKENDISVTTALNLNGGQQYTFVVYSVNSSSELPDVSTTSRLSGTLLLVMNVADLMYYKKTFAVSGNEPNYLDVVLKHKTSRITTTIDASLTGGNISAISAHFYPHYTGTSILLQGGDVIYPPNTQSNAVVSFTGLGTPVVSAASTVVSADALNGEFVIPSITIGSVTRTDLKLTGIKITPGVRYNLNIQIKPL